MTVSETTEPQAAGGTVDDTVRELERELRAQGLRRWLRRGLLVFGVIALFVGFRIYKSLGAPPPQPRFELKALEKRDVVE
ncbi:MAG: hypothetical protein KC492_28465, partial [Myxococcales bacterium]|nr:hypothetical protein [Myxococcales bacterium]